MTEVTETTVSLEWSSPKDDGGSPLTGYVMEKREALRMVWNPVSSPTTTKYTATRLHEGTQYVFRVAAENKVGTGQFEELTKSIAAKSPHSKCC